MAKTLEERVDTLANAATTLIDCVAILAKAQIDPEVRLDVVAKLGSFVISEQRSDKDAK